jgi:hypothetical protein
VDPFFHAPTQTKHSKQAKYNMSPSSILLKGNLWITAGQDFLITAIELYVKYLLVEAAAGLVAMRVLVLKTECEDHTSPNPQGKTHNSSMLCTLL